MDREQKHQTSWARWQRLWFRLGGQTAPESVYELLWDRYHELHRTYHVWGHVQDCLREFDAALRPGSGIDVRHSDEVEMAIWFHDAVYETDGSDNEGLSAQLAATQLSRAGIVSEIIDRVQALILATRHIKRPDYPDAQLMVDVDLSPLGFAPEMFQRYSRYIRTEYSHVPAGEYCRERARILTALLDRPTLYTTRFFRHRYEAQARANLSSAVAELTNQAAQITCSAAPIGQGKRVTHRQRSQHTAGFLVD